MVNSKLILTGVSYSINKKYLLRDINLTLPMGKIITLLGENATGKSTLLKIIYGQLRPDSGQIMLDQQTIYPAQPDFNFNKDFYQHLGILPDKLPLYPELTVANYLAFVTELRQLPKTIATQQIEMLASHLDLTKVMRQKIATLSRGMQQCVAIAQAVIHQPKWLLLDEPFNALDQKHFAAVINLLSKLKAKTGILLTSHILTKIVAISDETVQLENASLQAVSTEYQPAQETECLS